MRLFIALAALIVAGSIVSSGEATHELGGLSTMQCALNPCVIQVENHFGNYGTLHGDARYQIAAEMMVNDWSKSGVYLKLVYPSSVPYPGMVYGLFCPAGDPGTQEDDVLCDPDGFGGEPSQCTPVCPAGAWENTCTESVQANTVMFCAARTTTGGNATRARIACPYEDDLYGWGDCNPLSQNGSGHWVWTRAMLCHEVGHMLGLDHEGGGCMQGVNLAPRPTLHDIQAVAALHAPNPNCFPGADVCSYLTTDSDGDDDGISNVAEANCGDGSYWNDAARVPEKLNGLDDNGNTLIDEQLWTTYVGGATNITTEPYIDDYDCDGDGYKGWEEQHIYAMATSDTARDQDRCDGLDGVHPTADGNWPANLDNRTGQTPDTYRRVNILEITSFTAPVRHLDTSPGDPLYDVRWDLKPGNSGLTKDINIVDLTSIYSGPTATPPMFLGLNQFYTQTACTD